MRITSLGEKQFVASVLIVSKELPKRILLVYHKKYDLWIQPGGHIERFENPLEAAIRETKEETGIDLSILEEQKIVIDEQAVILPLPRFILEEKVAAYKEEPAHVHLDLEYYAEVSMQKVKFNIIESGSVQWFNREEVSKLRMFPNSKVIISQIL
jgi:8-oxo-dGTP pyrophosphatase MutT (NUDIX family)